MFGQSAKKPLVGRVLQLPLPPAQFWKPDLIKLTPISITVGPVTSGGKIFFSTRGGMKDIKISSRAATIAVAMMAPKQCVSSYSSQ